VLLLPGWLEEIYSIQRWKWLPLFVNVFNHYKKSTKISNHKGNIELKKGMPDE
jgi:hypothetical protein